MDKATISTSTVSQEPVSHSLPPKSQLSVLHQKYKTLNSSNLHAQFQQEPSLWREYHKISEANERSSCREFHPLETIIDYLETLNMKKSFVVADLGCGLARICKHFVDKDSRFSFYNFDHVACDDIVTTRDIQDTGLDDASVDIAVLCLAMWGSNCKDYLTEVHRILDKGGRLLIIEPYKRWFDVDTQTNRLKMWVEEKFSVSTCDERKFMFIEAFKVK